MSRDNNNNNNNDDEKKKRWGNTSSRQHTLGRVVYRCDIYLPHPLRLVTMRYVLWGKKSFYLHMRRIFSVVVLVFPASRPGHFIIYYQPPIRICIRVRWRYLLRYILVSCASNQSCYRLHVTRYAFNFANIFSFTRLVELSIPSPKVNSLVAFCISRPAVWLGRIAFFFSLYRI